MTVAIKCKLKRIVSFGFKHEAPAKKVGVVVVDVRQMFWNPYSDRTLRHRTGQDADVQTHVMQTPNFAAKYRHIKEQAMAPGTDEIWIGCQGGQHRSVFLAEKLGKELGIQVAHRDLTNP